MEWYQVLGTELLGTAILVLLGNGIVANVILKNTKGNNAGWLAITIGWGFAVFIGAFASSALGGVAHLNPAVTIAFLASGDWIAQTGTEIWMFSLFIGGQIVGAIVGQILVDLVYSKNIIETLDSSDEGKAKVLGMHSTGPQSRNILVNFFAEFVGTAVLVLVIMLTTSFAKTQVGIVGPIVVMISVIGIGLSLGGVTGYAINPVRDLMPRIVHQILPAKKGNKGSSDWGYSWIPVAAPILAGAVVGLIFMI